MVRRAGPCGSVAARVLYRSCSRFVRCVRHPRVVCPVPRGLWHVSCVVPGTRYVLCPVTCVLVSYRYVLLVCPVLCPVSWFPVSCVLCPVSCVIYPVSCIRCPVCHVFCLSCLASCIPCPVSRVMFRVFCAPCAMPRDMFPVCWVLCHCVLYPVSCLPYNVSCVKCHGARVLSCVVCPVYCVLRPASRVQVGTVVSWSARCDSDAHKGPRSLRRRPVREAGEACVRSGGGSTILCCCCCEGLYRPWPSHMTVTPNLDRLGMFSGKFLGMGKIVEV